VQTILAGEVVMPNMGEGSPTADAGDEIYEDR